MHVYIRLLCSQGVAAWLGGNKRPNKWPRCVWGGAKTLEVLWLEGGNTVGKVNEKNEKRPVDPAGWPQSLGPAAYCRPLDSFYSLQWRWPGLEEALGVLWSTVSYCRSRPEISGSGSMTPEFLHFCFITASEQLNWFSFCFGLGIPGCAEQDRMQAMLRPSQGHRATVWLVVNGFI